VVATYGADPDNADNAAYLASAGYAGYFNGNVGIGTTTPIAKLHVESDASVTAIKVLNSATISPIRLIDIERTTDPDGANDIIEISVPGTAPDDFQFLEFDRDGDNVFIVAGNGDLDIDGAGTQPGGGSWIAASDKRLKHGIEPYTDGLTKLMKVDPVWYSYNAETGLGDSKKRHVGIIAQEMQKIAPYMIGKSQLKDAIDDGGTSTNRTEYLNYNGTALTYMLVNSVKEQQGIIAKQQKQIDELLQAVKALQTK
jgi:hypothetical protein